MFCKNCGKEISDNSEFCKYCGSKKDNVSTEKNQSEVLSKKFNLLKIIAPIVIVVIILFAFFSSGIKLVDNNSNNIKQSTNIEKSTDAKADSRIEQLKILSQYDDITDIEQVDTITFGSYPHYDLNGNKKDEIEWFVLKKENNEYLLLSKDVIAGQIWSDNKNVRYKDSNVRNWLNNEFYNTALY